MNQGNTSQLWSAVLHDVSTKIPKERYEIWLKDTSLAEITDDACVVKVPNKFAKEYVSSRLGATIESSIHKVVGEQRTLRLQIAPEIQKKNTNGSKHSSSGLEQDPPSFIPTKRNTNCLLAPLRSDMTLESFVIGSCNRLAHAAAWTIAEGEECYSPYFVHGNTGLGKTHLLQAICHALAKQNPHLKIAYMSCNTFVADFCSSVSGKTWEAFSQKMCDLDVLAIDDIQYLANKKGTQKEFLSIYNELDNRHKQILLASDTHPKLIKNLDDGVRSRFMSGIVAKVDLPSYPTRLTILQQSMRRSKSKFPTAILELVARLYEGNVRELLGLAQILSTEARLSSCPLTEPNVIKIVREFMNQVSENIGIQDIETEVCKLFNITTEQIKSRKQVRTISQARQTAMYLAKRHLGISYQEIGDYFGGKNHATVMNAERNVKNRIEKEPEFKSNLNHLSQKLGIKC